MLLQALPRVSHAPLAIINSSNSRTKLLLYCARSPGTRAIKLLKSRLRSVLLTAGLLSGASVIAHPATAEETATATSESQEEIIQRILELRGEIEELLELLPVEMREEVERRWRDRQQVDLAPQSEPEGQTEVEPEGQQESPTTQAAQPELPEEPARTAEPEPEVTPASADEVTKTASPCGGFHLFDTSEDLLVSGGDRPWRYLRLWFDQNADGAIDDAEIESLFELGVREIDVGLQFYINDEGESEDVDVEDLIWLRQVGKGGGKRRSGALAAAADRLAHGGQFWLVDGNGTQLTGYQALGSASFLETSDGERLPVLCLD